MAEDSITSLETLGSFFDIEPAPVKEIGFPRRKYNHMYDDVGLVHQLENPRDRFKRNGEPMSVCEIIDDDWADLDDGLNEMSDNRFAMSDER